MATPNLPRIELHLSADTSQFASALSAAMADQYWTLADQYLAESSDPDSSFEEREYARDLYADAVRDAQQAEADGR